jgi:hypothetical protein
MTDFAHPVPFIDLTLSPVGKPFYHSGQATLEKQAQAAKKPSNVLGKRERPLASGDVSTRAAKKTTTHAGNKINKDALEESLLSDNKENASNRKNTFSVGRVREISSRLEAALDLQYAHEIHLTHLENEVRTKFESRPFSAELTAQAFQLATLPYRLPLALLALFVPSHLLIFVFLSILLKDRRGSRILRPAILFSLCFRLERLLSAPCRHGGLVARRL